MKRKYNFLNAALSLLFEHASLTAKQPYHTKVGLELIPHSFSS